MEEPLKTSRGPLSKESKNEMKSIPLVYGAVAPIINPKMNKFGQSPDTPNASSISTSLDAVSSSACILCVVVV